MLTRLIVRGAAQRAPVRGSLQPIANNCSAHIHSRSHLPKAARLFSDTARKREEGTKQDANPGAAGNSLREKVIESAATTLASVVVLALAFTIASAGYHLYYKDQQLRKMAHAFEPGDPVLELAAKGKDVPKEDDNHWITRPEQIKIDGIVDGSDQGHYHLLMGEKGTGKSSMLLEAMGKIDGVGCALVEAHADLEIFRARLGKALDYEYHEDYIGGYFNERGPRDSTALLDIERALNKLEKVALQNRTKRKKPLILIINQMHLIRDDDDGKDLLELLQQKAEQWAAASLVTVILNSDHYWIFERLKQLATRLEVTYVTDLPKSHAMAALRSYRHKYRSDEVEDSLLEQVYDRVGGRLTFLNRVAKAKDMLIECDSIKEAEKTWLLNQCWVLGADMDDDAMEQQKYACAAMVLAQALVDLEPEMEKTYDPIKGHVLPSLPMHKSQEIMTRSDFIRELDQQTIFTITNKAQVRASSVPMHQAFREICGEPGFREHLDASIQRVGDIESLGRTREVVAKDLVLGGSYEAIPSADRGNRTRITYGESRDGSGK